MISLIAFAGALTLFLKEKLVDKLLLVLAAFSAGSLIGGAFLHLMPEAIAEFGQDESSLLKLFLYFIFGFCLFFILEQFIKWHHHAREHPKLMPFSWLILVSDAVHNFIDGIVIAAAFIVALPVGITTALAVALHEIPQEIGDYGILIYGGFKKAKALFLNFLSAITVIAGGVIGFFLSGQIGDSIVFLLPVAAGSFVYIAASDLIPEIKAHADLKKSITYFLTFLLGIMLMLLIKFL